MTRVRHHVNPFAVRQSVTFDGFNDDRPIMVDIGACRGIFARKLVERLPTHNIILCEIRNRLVAELKTKFNPHANVTVLDGNAVQNLQQILAPSIARGVRIDTLFVNFPDPWPKPRHHKRRFLTPQLLADLATWLPAETKIVFQTDHPTLWTDTLGYILQSPFRTVRVFSTAPHGVATQWERQKSAEGAQIFRAELRLR